MCRRRYYILNHWCLWTTTQRVNFFNNFSNRVHGYWQAFMHAMNQEHHIDWEYYIPWEQSNPVMRILLHDGKVERPISMFQNNPWPFFKYHMYEIPKFYSNAYSHCNDIRCDVGTMDDELYTCFPFAVTAICYVLDKILRLHHHWELGNKFLFPFYY